ncbi:MAG: hypothetical protein SPE09_04660 [Alloprevotella sp.]|nr:hypothetical protein [Alloprevotella sp.]
MEMRKLKQFVYALAAARHEKKKILWLFFLSCARLALLCFAKIGGGSEEEKQNFQLCFSFFSRLALSLQTL